VGRIIEERLALLQQARDIAWRLYYGDEVGRQAFTELGIRIDELTTVLRQMKADGLRLPLR